MRLILVNSPCSHSHPIVRDMAGGFGLDSGGAMVLPPADLLLLAAALREKGHAVSFVDADAVGHAPTEAAAAIEAAGPADAVVCTLSLNTLELDAAFLRGLRRFHRGRVWIRTDIPYTPLLQECLEKSRADGVLSTENVWAAERALTGASRAGTWWLEGEMLVSGPAAQTLQPDEAPLPARELVAGIRYRYPFLGEPIATVKSSFGCPYPCAFYCPYPAIEGKKWRPRSAASVAAELEDIATRQGLRKVLFRDATFTLDKARAKEICRAVIARGLDLEWWCETRVDCLDDELLDLFFRAGLKGFNVGIESGDEGLRSGSLKTGVSMEKIEWFLKACRRLGLRQHFLMTAGLPGETRGTFLNTFRMLARLRPDSFHFTFVTPYPGTPLFEEARRRGWIVSGDWSRYGADTPVMRSDNLDVDELVFARTKLMELRHWLSSRESDASERLGRLEAEFERWAREAPAGGRAPAVSTSTAGPVASVVIPSYRRVGGLLAAIEGLARQTIPPNRFETIVVHDGPTDFGSGHWPEVRRRLPGVRLLAQEHRGPAAARNRALRDARGELLVFMDDDTSPPPDFLKTHLAFHQAHPEPVEGLLGRVTWAPHMEPTRFMRWLEESGRQFAFFMLENGRPIPEPYRFFSTCNLSLKRSFVLGEGGFDADFPYATFEDIELGYRLSRKGLRLTYDARLLSHHVRSSSMSDFAARTRRAGWSGALCLRKHPELAELTYPNLLTPAALLPEAAWRSVAESLNRLDPETDEELALCGMALDRLYLEGFLEGTQAHGLPEPASSGRGAWPPLLRALTEQWESQISRTYLSARLAPKPPAPRRWSSFSGAVARRMRRILGTSDESVSTPRH